MEQLQTTRRKAPPLKQRRAHRLRQALQEIFEQQLECLKENSDGLECHRMGDCVAHREEGGALVEEEGEPEGDMRWAGSAQ